MPWVISILLFMVCSNVAYGQDTLLPDLEQSVIDLLQFDTQRALNTEVSKQWQQRGYSSLGQTMVTEPSHSSNKTSLSAIYGLGDRLHASISIDGQRIVLKKGESFLLPQGRISLRSIRPPCINLEGPEPGISQDLCIYGQP